MYPGESLKVICLMVSFIQLRHVIIIDDDLTESFFIMDTEKDKKIHALLFINIFYVSMETTHELLWENRKVNVGKPDGQNQGKEEVYFRLLPSNYFDDSLRCSCGLHASVKDNVHICIPRKKMTSVAFS
jgi:hypothetical protein